jgi:hypothetical protein
MLEKNQIFWEPGMKVSKSWINQGEGVSRADDPLNKVENQDYIYLKMSLPIVGGTRVRSNPLTLILQLSRVMGNVKTLPKNVTKTR